MPGDQNAQVDLGRSAQELPATGLHTVRVTFAEQKQASTGNPMIAIRSTIIGDRDPDAGKTIFMNFMLLPQSRFVLDKFLDAIHAPASGKMSVGKFVGCRLRVLVNHEERDMKDGTTRKQVRVTDYIPIPEAKSFEGGQVDPVDAKASAEGGARLDAIVNPKAMEDDGGTGESDPF